MRRRPYGLYAIALAILVVGLVAVGVPASTLLFMALVLACPLMMVFMHGSGHGGHGGHGGGNAGSGHGGYAPGQDPQRPGRGRPTRAVIRAASLRRDRAGRPADGEIDLYRCSGYPRSDGVDACAHRLGG